MRIVIFVIATSAALMACGQPSAPAAAQGGGAPAAAAQADYIAQCTADLVAQNPRASEWGPAQCEQQWAAVVAAGPMAEAILTAAPVSGAADPATLRGRLGTVRWDARAEGALIASGRLGDDLSVQVDRAGPSLNFYWSETGALIPYDIIGALRVRGADLTMVGCYPLGTGENNQAYRVVAPDRAPFELSVYGRTAPTANAESFYNVGVALSGRVKTLADLRREDSTWSAACS